MRHFAVLVPLPIWGQQCAFEKHEKTCFAGSAFLKVGNIGSVEECCSVCQDHDGCTHFTLTGNECGLKTGSPAESEHTHCTSGILNQPGPVPPHPPPPPGPSPPPPPPPPGPPSPPPSDHPSYENVKYERDGQCLSLGTLQGERHISYSTMMVDCNSGAATSWTEGESFQEVKQIVTDSHRFRNDRGNYQPQIVTDFEIDEKTKGRTCLAVPDATCQEGDAMKTWSCAADVKGEASGSRIIWDDRLKLLRSKKCWGMCVDLESDTPVLRDCSKIKNQWKRHGPSLPPISRPEEQPPPGPPGPKTGRYHLTWPLPQVKGYTVAGIGEDGYPEYFGGNNGEMCPEEEKGLVKGEIRCSWPKLDEIPFKWAPRKHKLEGTNYPIKRSHIVQRAIIWAANHWHKFGDEDEDESGENTELGAAMSRIAECDKGRTCNLDGCAEGESAYCPQFFHGGACCATIGNAWNASTKNCWRGPRTSIRVPCDEMRPGDGISKGGGDKTTPDGHDFPSGSHVVVFRKWENPQKTFMTVFTNKRQTTMPRYDHMYCFKRKNIIEDIEPEFQEEIVMEEDEPETQEELVV